MQAMILTDTPRDNLSQVRELGRADIEPRYCRPVFRYVVNTPSRWLYRLFL